MTIITSSASYSQREREAHRRAFDPDLTLLNQALSGILYDDLCHEHKAAAAAAMAALDDSQALALWAKWTGKAKPEPLSNHYILGRVR